MEVLLLRFEAPLMSFGAPIVDNRGVIQPYPALSMICGLLGNALGYHHRDADALHRLQERLRYASRQDRRGTRLRDYQTVDLGQDFMRDDCAWTTRGELERRKGGSASTGTHIRLRDYWADAAHTVALTLDPADEAPAPGELAEALERPERPLFIGRKPCLPAGRMLLGCVDAPNLLHALCRAPAADGAGPGELVPAWWPTEPGEDEPGRTKRPVTDARDWANQVHVGQRWVASGQIEIEPEDHHHG
ncbi:MAG: type I-E CRISPR-associated protein Cas5/CasD [Planctomycetota bacterium]